MIVEVENYHVNIHSGTQDEVSRLFNKNMKAGAFYVHAPLQDPDTEQWFATMDLPDRPKTFVHTAANRRVIYLSIRAMARSLHCAVFLDITRERYYLRIKGTQAHDERLIKLIGQLVGEARIHKYHKGAGPAVSIVLTGLGIVHETRY